MSELEQNPYAAPGAIAAVEVPAPPEQLYVGAEFAGSMGPRMLALLIDYAWTSGLGIVSGVFGAICLGILQALGQVAPGWAAEIGKQSPILYLGSFAASIAYFAVSEAVGGTSVGKALFGLRVVSQDFQWAGIGKTLGRRFAVFIDLLFFGIPAYSSMKDDPYKQRLGDRWAGTYVIKNEGLPEGQRRSSSRVLLGVALGTAVNVVIMTAAMVMKVL